MIEVRELTFRYPHATRAVLQHIALTIAEGEILTILGPNGSGKSTLLRLLRGSLSADEGSVALKGVSIGSLSQRAIARNIAVVPQQLPRLFSFPVRDVVRMGRFASRGLFGRGSADDGQMVAWALGESDTAHLAERSVMHISGGELQRVLMARALAQNTPILMLDEASSHLDINHRIDMMHLLKRLNRKRGTTVVQVSHDFNLSAALSDRILILNAEGRVIALGSPAEALTPATIKEAFGIEAEITRNRQTGSPQVDPVIEFV
jgi:iron complex transport system ATP-binding protein